METTIKKLIWTCQTLDLDNYIESLIFLIVATPGPKPPKDDS